MGRDFIYEENVRMNEMSRSKIKAAVTHRAQLSEERDEFVAARIAELFFEEVDIDDDVGYRVLVHRHDVALCEEVLQNAGRGGVDGGEKSKEGERTGQDMRGLTTRTMRHWAIYVVAPRYASSLYASRIWSESTTVVSQLMSS
jgi:hypothetical protein